MDAQPGVEGEASVVLPGDVLLHGDKRVAVFSLIVSCKAQYLGGRLWRVHECQGCQNKLTTEFEYTRACGRLFDRNLVTLLFFGLLGNGTPFLLRPSATVQEFSESVFHREWSRANTLPASLCVVAPSTKRIACLPAGE